MASANMLDAASLSISANAHYFVCHEALDSLLQSLFPSNFQGRSLHADQFSMPFTAQLYRTGTSFKSVVPRKESYVTN